MSLNFNDKNLSISLGYPPSANDMDSFFVKKGHLLLQKLFYDFTVAMLRLSQKIIFEAISTRFFTKKLNITYY
ncbi:hypothetical protein A2483_01810 [Candidatus Peregrinibacteria bacterium RIFOXYC2_FULL_33_13]|nr:MAG: hypothetical protein UR27_C0001G0027 [Candidatus Peregrinibacteria bacterium GW2011_GWA2_33_10]KKP39757.1 MAG: hypothetical protein UR30_C0008G0026 [Candidatus Peregrinibacteria bacterium GW2011_GWC2_33_13]OGJ50445.1 MAG: hypothetical protein A2229_02485 [Candidatus Peregrinibacteria bacterium RIFOXYA2_FULL_33_7]OGJ52628.1 MAG: hypothetical protein A2483_01810 [Candidatus Peregrinibacteria bacterium RIFOXYC2_FULL_33_13]